MKIMLLLVVAALASFSGFVVQNVFIWVVWILMAFTIVYGYEVVMKLTNKKSP